MREAASQPFDGWCELYESFSPLDLETGERWSRVPPPNTDLRRAAVLVPVLVESEEAWLIYTVRKDYLHDHAGQISFPGGNCGSEDDSLLETALREAEEEIDLRPDLVEVIGKLEELYISTSRFLVTPFVGLLRQETELLLDSEEVEGIFSVSLEELMSPDSIKKVSWEHDGRPHEVAVFAIEGREIWGATAAITAGLLARLGWKAGGLLNKED